MSVHKNGFTVLVPRYVFEGNVYVSPDSKTTSDFRCVPHACVHGHACLHPRTAGLRALLSVHLSVHVCVHVCMRLMCV